MADVSPRDPTPVPEPDNREPDNPDLDGPDPDGPAVQPIRQPKDKSAKLVYRDKQFVADFLAKHILGKVVPDEIASRIDLTGLQPGPTEHVDPKMRTSRLADLVWRAPFGDSWFYVVFLFEFEATPKWRMPVRILVETALAYDYLSKDTEASRERKLPPVLPIVVDVGGRPWPLPTRLEDLLAEEAQGFLTFALGQEFVLVSEAEEARGLERVETAREAALKLRYAATRAEYKEALAVLAEWLPRDSAAREGLLAWVRSLMIEAGATEAEMAKVKQLEDLGGPVVDSWWAREGRELRRRGREEGRQEAETIAREDQRATLVRLAGRKFGEAAAGELAALLEGVSGPERLAEVADLIIDCASGPELLARAAETT